MGELNISNFSKALKRDAALDGDRFLTAYALENYDVSESRGALVKRKGSARWNSNAFAANAKQIHHFIDSSENEKVLVVANSNIYVMDSNGANTPGELLIDGTTSHAMGLEPYQFLNVGDRCFFNDNNGWYWVDNDSLGSNTSYQAGIDLPTAPSGYGDSDKIFYDVGSNTGIVVNITSTQKLEQSFTYTVSGITSGKGVYFADGVRVRVANSGASTATLGHVRFRVETDSGGDPSGTLAHDNSETIWVEVSSMNATFGNLDFAFPDVASFVDGDTYHIVLETDDAYKLQYSATAGATDIAWARVDPGTYADGSAKTYNGTSWSAATYDLEFQLGLGLTTDDTYNYKYAFENSTYGISSRPTDEHSVVSNTSGQNVIGLFNRPSGSYAAIASTTDTQVDKLAIYRTDAQSATSDATYRILGRVALDTEIVIDAVGDAFLASAMQSDNNYRLRDADGTVTKIERAAVFKNRIFATIIGSDTLFYSNKLPDEGALGNAGDPKYESFHANNRFETSTSGKLLNVLPISIMTTEGPFEFLVAYFSNAIHIFSGGNSATNPLNDLKHQVVIQGAGLIGTSAVAQVRGKHIFVARSGVYAFNGSPTLERLSHGFVQSILDDISDDNLAISICRECDDGLWLALDTDDDGTLDRVWILDLSSDLPKWKPYRYNFDINDFVVRSAGDKRNQVLFAHTLDNFIREAETGGSDRDASNNEVNVDAFFETHPLSSELDEDNTYRRLFFHNTEVTPYYPTQGQVPLYTLTITDIEGVEDTQSFSPLNQSDIRAHSIGHRVQSEEARFKIQQSSRLRDEIRKLTFRWA